VPLRSITENTRQPARARALLISNIPLRAPIASVDSRAGGGLSLARNGDIYIASLPGNVFQWYPGWVEGAREEAPGVVK
jgi:hypothetical protein